MMTMNQIILLLKIYVGQHLSAPGGTHSHDMVTLTNLGLIVNEGYGPDTTAKGHILCTTLKQVASLAGSN